MPTVPVYFFYEGYNRVPGFSSGGAAHDWLIQATYHDANALHDGTAPTPQSYALQRSIDGDNTGVIGITPVLFTQFPQPHTVAEVPNEYQGWDSSIGYYYIQGGEYGMFLAGSITYPDSWYGVFIQVSVHTIAGRGYYAFCRAPALSFVGHRPAGMASSINFPTPVPLDWANREPSLEAVWEEYGYTHSTLDGPIADDEPTAYFGARATLYNFHKTPKAHDYTIQLAYGDGATDTATGTTTVSGLMAGISGYSDGDEPEMVSVGGSFPHDQYPPQLKSAQSSVHNFTHLYDSVPGVPIKARVEDGFGQKSLWYRSLRIRPVANLSASVDDDGLISADGSNSYALDRPIVFYYWQLFALHQLSGGGTQTITENVLSTSPLYSYQLPDDFDGEYSVTLSVVTNVASDAPEGTVLFMLNPSVWTQRDYDRRDKWALAEVDQTLANLYDRRTGELRTLYRDNEGDLRCARNFQIEPLALGTAQPLVAGNRKPGGLERWGKSVFAFSRECELYESKDCGQTWDKVMSFMDNSRLLGQAKSRDGSTLYALSLGSDNSVTRSVLKRNGGGDPAWFVQEQSGVSGLPSGLRRPSGMTYDGVTFVLTYRNSGNLETATSTDAMKTWAVVL